MPGVLFVVLQIKSAESFTPVKMDVFANRPPRCFPCDPDTLERNGVERGTKLGQLHRNPRSPNYVELCRPYGYVLMLGLIILLHWRRRLDEQLAKSMLV